MQNLPGPTRDEPQTLGFRSAGLGFKGVRVGGGELESEKIARLRNETPHPIPCNLDPQPST